MQFRFFALALLFATCALASSTHDNTQRNTQRTLLEYKQKITQPDYSEGYPNSTKYFEKRILPAGAGGMGMAGVGIFIFIIFCCCRCGALCCQCCKNKFFDCMCGTGKGEGDPDVGYSKMQRTILLIILIVCAVGLAIGGIVGDQGMNKVVDGAVDLLDSAVGSVNQMSKVVTVIQGAMTNLGQSPDTKEMNKAIADVKKTIDDRNKDVNDQTDRSKLVSKIFFAVFCVNTLLGFGAWMCNKGCPATCMTINSFFLLILAWVLFAVFYMGGAFLDDTCVQLDLWYKCKMPNTPKGTDCSKLSIDAFLKCPSSDSFSKGYKDSLDQVDNLINVYHMRFGKKFTFPNATCPSGASCVNMAAFSNWPANAAWRKVQYTAVAGKCAPGKKKAEDYAASCLDSSCSNKDLKNGINDPKTLSDTCLQKAVLTAADVLWGSSYVASCTFLTSIAGSSVADSGSCNKLGDGFVYIFAAFGLIGCLYFIVVFVGIHGSTAWAGEAHQDGNDAVETVDMSNADGQPLEGSAAKDSAVLGTTSAQSVGSGSGSDNPFVRSPEAELQVETTQDDPSSTGEPEKSFTRGCCAAPSN